jgi:hypothetical protein
MLGLRWLEVGAKRGQRVAVLLLQRCAGGVCCCWPGPGVNVCSTFLEGKEELEVKNVLFKVGLSASGMLCVGAMGGVILVVI